jgi:hypothetical protein
VGVMVLGVGEHADGGFQEVHNVRQNVGRNIYNTSMGRKQNQPETGDSATFLPRHQTAVRCLGGGCWERRQGDCAKGFQGCDLYRYWDDMLQYPQREQRHSVLPWTVTLMVLLLVCCGPAKAFLAHMQRELNFYQRHYEASGWRARPHNEVEDVASWGCDGQLRGAEGVLEIVSGRRELEMVLEYVYACVYACMPCIT